MNPGAVVFDLDGTLIDSAPQVLHATNGLLAAHGRRALTAAEIKPMMGKGARVTIERALAATGSVPDDPALDRAVDDYLALYLDDPASHTGVYPGVFEVLARLAADGVALGVCTNKPGATTLPVLQALGLDRYFRAVLSADDVPPARRKPHPDHLTETLARMATDADDAVYVGDSQVDVQAARNAGWPVIAVAYGYAEGDPRALGADRLIDRFADLPEALRWLPVPAAAP